MTQPVQEPTTQRSIGYDRWRVNQLERRPSPGGGEFSFFRAARYGDDIPNINDSPEFVEWLYWDESYDPTIFELLNPLHGVIVDPESGVDIVRYVRLLLPGRYSFHFGVNFDDGPGNPDGSVMLYYYDENPIWGRFETITHGPNEFNGEALPTDFYVGTWAHAYPLYDPFDPPSGPFTPEITYRIGSNSTFDLTCTQAFLEIHYFPATVTVTSGT